MSEFLELSQEILAAATASRGGQPRPQQEQMVAAIVSSLESEENLAVQADTGVGKSIAYLAPIMAHLSLNGSGTALLGTATLALQRQVITVDAAAVIEATEAVSGQRLKAGVLKGWSNYACRYLLEGDPTADIGEPQGLFDRPDIATSSTSSSADAKTWVKVLKWLESTPTGDRDDLNVKVSGPLWSKMSVSKRECLGRSCPYVEDCFPAAAREEAFASDLVVTNHSVLSIAMKTNPEVVPDPAVIIVDEAHSLAETTRRQATASLAERTISGAARAVRPLSSSSAGAIDLAADRFDFALRGVEVGLLRARPASLSETIHEVGEQAREALRAIKDVAPSMALQTARSRLDALVEATDSWGRDPQESIVWKTEHDSGEDSLNIAPLRVEGTIARGLTDRAPTVFTSATLALGVDLGPMVRRLGLEKSSRSFETVDVGGPFDARTQGILLVPQHLPAPGRSGLSEEAAHLFVDLAKAAQGGVLGLFTSHRAAAMAADALRDQTDFNVLVQGEDSISALVEAFRDDPDSCLIGSRALWQGVDVRGQACRLVVMDRIPFPRPDDPIAQSLATAAQKSGGSGFFEASLVPAALLLAQGAGRLLRSPEDRGVVAVLDQRLVSRSYGPFLVRAMPDFWKTQDSEVALEALTRLSAAGEDELLSDVAAGETRGPRRPHPRKIGELATKESK